MCWIYFLGQSLTSPSPTISPGTKPFCITSSLASLQVLVNLYSTGKECWDIPCHESLSRAPDGYSCNENQWDERQYCLCKPGERIVKFKSRHSNEKEDRIWDLGCKLISPRMTVEGDRWISKTERSKLDNTKSWDGRHSNSFLVGMESEHSNHHEDRTYTFFTARSDNFDLRQCSAWKKLNNHDHEINLQLGNDEVIAAIKSVHDNKKEDREFSVVTCKIGRTTGEILPFQNMSILFLLYSYQLSPKMNHLCWELSRGLLIQ